MGLMKTLSQSSKELKDILDRLTALESGETFATKEMLESLNQTVTTINTDVTNIKNGDNIGNIMLANYPVGSIYLSVDSANPSTKFGGTWVAWGAGRVLVGIGTGTDINGNTMAFETVEKTGGEYTHKLTESELPNHRHKFSVSNHGNSINPVQVVSDSGSNVMRVRGGNETDELHYTERTGSGRLHNNLQPYITCYMWKRTA